jgi:hypothetical protein
LKIPKFNVRENPALVLFLLAPAIGELLSGSAPPSEFFTPFGLTMLLGLYGGGAVLARELKVRWRKGMGSLLLLGAAYGALEEGVMVASWSSPVWPDLGTLGVFGRWLGVNWVWAAELTMYHAIVSITIPVMLVELAYPERKKDTWLSDWWVKTITVALAVDVIVGFTLFGILLNYFPPLPQYSLAFAATAFFTYKAYKLPSNWTRKGVKPLRRPLYYAVITALGALSSGVVFWILPNLSNFILFPLLIIICGFGIIYSIIKLFISYNWKNSTPLHLFAVSSGPLYIFIILTFLQESDKSRTDNTAGMGLIGIIALVGLALLWLKLKRNNAVTTTVL